MEEGAGGGPRSGRLQRTALRGSAPRSRLRPARCPAPRAYPVSMPVRVNRLAATRTRVRTLKRHHEFGCWSQDRPNRQSRALVLVAADPVDLFADAGCAWARRGGVRASRCGQALYSGMKTRAHAWADADGRHHESTLVQRLRTQLRILVRNDVNLSKLELERLRMQLQTLVRNDTNVAGGGARRTAPQKVGILPGAQTSGLGQHARSITDCRRWHPHESESEAPWHAWRPR